MKKYLVFFVIATTAAGIVFAATCSEKNNPCDSGDTDECQKFIDNCGKKLAEEQGKEKTLASEIAYMDGQLNLTELRIQNSIQKIAKTTKDIEKLSGDINDIAGRIVKLEFSIDYQKKILNARLRSRYKIQEASPVIILFGATTLNQLVQRAEYLQVMEIQDNKLLKEMADTKDAYNKQKGILEDTKATNEKLKASLVSEKANLDTAKATLLDQQQEKKRLLEATQNNESNYQRLITEAQQELLQITGAVSVLKNQASLRVKKGDIIGTQGSTGFSTGDHLHFGVYKYASFSKIDGWNWYYSNYYDPAKMLSSKTVYWDTGCSVAEYKTVGSGSWQWPLSGPTVSQGFGHTCWSNVYYGGKDHPALDMYGPYGSAVHAAEAGNAYFCRNCLGDGGNGVFIFHDNGYMTLYWHMR